MRFFSSVSSFATSMKSQAAIRPSIEIINKPETTKRGAMDELLGGFVVGNDTTVVGSVKLIVSSEGRMLVSPFSVMGSVRLRKVFGCTGGS